MSVFISNLKAIIVKKKTISSFIHPEMRKKHFLCTTLVFSIVFFRNGIKGSWWSIHFRIKVSDRTCTVLETLNCKLPCDFQHSLILISFLIKLIVFCDLFRNFKILLLFSRFNSNILSLYLLLCFYSSEKK